LRRVAPIAIVVTIFIPVASATAGEVSVERGLRLSIVAGCNDCHTQGFIGEGKLDPDKALKGGKMGWRGPWGTTYALNLRLTAKNLTEDEFVLYLSKLKTRPPMPWYNVRAMEEDDMRSPVPLHQIARRAGRTGAGRGRARRRADDPIHPAPGAASKALKGEFSPAWANLAAARCNLDLALANLTGVPGIAASLIALPNLGACRQACAPSP